MATNVPNVSIMECSLLRVPSGYFQFTSLDDDTEPGNRTGVCALGSNSIIISEKTWSTLSSSYAKHTRSNHAWCAIVFGLKTEHAIVGSENQSCRRIVQVINNQRVSDNTVVISNDFLFNIFGNTKFSSKIQMERIPVMTLSCESISDNELPPRATKVVLSLLYNDLENYFVDDLLLKYFAYPRYLHSGDVFSVHVDDSHTLQCLNGLNVDTVCFKVSEVQGALTDTQGLFKESGLYLVDSSVAVYQSASNRGFVPPRCVPMLPKPNLWSLLSDERFLKQSFSHYQCLVPLSFDVAFETLRLWTEPFLFNLDQIKGMKLNPLFLVAGQNGSGKSMLVQALTQFLGVAYWRVDCVTVGGGTPGQAEGKIKAIFAQLGSVAPCVLHLANIEALFQDIESKVDTRVVRCFETQVNQLSGRKPVVIVGSTHSIKTISSDVNYLFLDSLSVPAPTCEQREQIIEWLVWSSAGAIDSQVVQAVASQTSGFAFRDLQVLVALAFKGKCKRLQRENDENSNFIVQDFSRVIEVMHKAYSESIGAPKVPSVSWKDVGGLESLKTEILRSLRSNMFSTGLKRSGLLLHGPPGTGKTLLAKAVATQCNRNFLSVKGPELLNMYVGQSEQNVRDLFELAKVASPCIVFFDELDSLAPNRGRSGDSGGVMDRVVSQLLAEMDDLGSSGDVFILGATNRPDLIDPALLRPGRLDKLLYVGPCEDRNAQLSVITALTHKLLMGPDVDLQEIVSLMPKSVSGAQVSALCSAAWLSSARHLISSNKHTQKIDVVIERSHFLSALNSVFNQS